MRVEQRVPSGGWFTKIVAPVLAIREIEVTGYEFVDYSAIHYRPDDEPRHEVGRKTVTGNTDRFVLLFRMPL